MYSMEPFRNRLNITAAKYSLYGELVSLGPISGADLQLCNGSFQQLDGAFDIATKYYKACKIPARQLFDAGREPIFYDLYVPYTQKSGSAEEQKLYAIPMKLENYGDNAVWLNKQVLVAL